jgi:hypothetical protein
MKHKMRLETTVNFRDKKLNAAYQTIFTALSEMKRSGVNADEVLLAIKYLTERSRREGMRDARKKLKVYVGTRR